jgi:hypothetical protein
MSQDMSGRVAEYSGLVAHLARRHSKGQHGTSVEAEYDDLYQEGLINVWQTLERGITPTAELIAGRMTDWKRLMKVQSRRGGGRNGTINYDTILPLEDFHQLGAAV